ncbi:MAG: S1 RNA-binding domain-containing protein [Acutalibacteraceae bacterium]|jgi:small subunit ribosomal protein S1
MKEFRPEGWLIDTAENRAALRSQAALGEAMRLHQLLEARAAVCDSTHNLIVDLGCMKGIIPREEGALGVAEGAVKDIAMISRVNKPVSFFVTGFTSVNGRPYAMLSRRMAQEECRREYLNTLHPGDIIDARVTHLEPFGAFADIGCGIPSLIPIDAISVSRIDHPRERFSPGMDIRAVVRSIDAEGRICLSHKELLGTWEENAAMFAPGETVAGVVRSVEDYGIFVELTPNLAGLAEPREGVLPGQQASVYIKSLLPEKMKIKLIVIDTFRYDYSPAVPEYFFTGSHMERFVYSPECSSRKIETVFDASSED